MTPPLRKIIHLDMDAFFASIEQRDRPELRGKPVIVGGAPDSRGVVCTCSYEARPFGVHSAMASSKACRLCPQAIFLPPRLEAYKQVSMEIREIFYEYTDLVEPLSLDEAYLDVTVNKKGIPSATIIAREIRQQIRLRTRLTGSAGVSFNKFLAKSASDVNKPDGMKVITPAEADAFVAALPIERFYGIGKVTAKKMNQLGIFNGADLRKQTLPDLVERFGKSGVYYYEIARGIDNRPVEPFWERKSLGREITLDHDIDDPDQLLIILKEVADDVEQALQRLYLAGKTVTLKVKYDDFQQVTRSTTTRYEISRAADFFPIARDLLWKTEAGKRKVRLLGIYLSHFPEKAIDNYFQPELPF